MSTKTPPLKRKRSSSQDSLVSSNAGEPLLRGVLQDGNEGHDAPSTMPPSATKLKVEECVPPSSQSTPISHQSASSQEAEPDVRKALAMVTVDPANYPELPKISGEIILEAYTHKSLRIQTPYSVDIFSDNERLGVLGEMALKLAVANVLYQQKPTLKAAEIPVSAMRAPLTHPLH